jgi:histidyl-tRNA synthetase
MSVDAGPTPAVERPIGQVRGTRDWLPDDFARLAALEATLLDRVARAGYATMRTPVLEHTELHERKSGAAIVSKLYELADAHQGRICLRPELTASLVRAYAAEGPPTWPWRISLSGPVFRFETPQPGHHREFQQVGVELLGASGPAADGEIIWLADWALAEAGLRDVTIRLGHVGLILEMLRRSGLPTPAQSALVEMLSEAAGEGRNVHALELGLEQLADWLRATEAGRDLPLPVDQGDDPAVDRLFQTLVPVVVGRRSGHEILHRLRRKWDLGHSLLGVLEDVRARVHELAELKGPPGEILDRLARDHESIAPESVAALRALVATLHDYGIDPDRIELDLGFGRGIGFYSQTIFELVAATPDGPVEVCGGGRYDGLARVLGGTHDDRGVGFACGLERLLLVLDAQGRGETKAEAAAGCLIVAQTPELGPQTLRLATEYRSRDGGRWEDGGPIVLGLGRSPDEAFDHARTLGLASVVVVRREPEKIPRRRPVTIGPVRAGSRCPGSWPVEVTGEGYGGDESDRESAHRPHPDRPPVQGPPL